MARTVPSESTRSPGDGLTAAYMNSNVRDGVNFCLTPPLARIHQATTQSVTNNTWTAISFDATDWDSDSGHSNSVNNSRYTSQVQGYYEVNFGAGFATNTSPIAAIAKNGTRIGGTGSVGGGNATPNGSARTMDVVHLNVGDYVEGYIYQTSGGTISTSVTGENIPCMNVKWIYSG